MSSYRELINQKKDQEIDAALKSKVAELVSQGYLVEFGNIGSRTTYALIYNESKDYEVVGYTFLKDKSRHRESVGKLKALQQAIARQELERESGGSNT